MGITCISRTKGAGPWGRSWVFSAEEIDKGVCARKIVASSYRLTFILAIGYKEVQAGPRIPWPCNAGCAWQPNVDREGRIGLPEPSSFLLATVAPKPEFPPTLYQDQDTRILPSWLGRGTVDDRNRHGILCADGPTARRSMASGRPAKNPISLAINPVPPCAPKGIVGTG